MILITGAGGQLGAALAEAFPGARALSRTEWDVAEPYPLDERPELVLHAAAWTKVDDAEAEPDGARRVNVEGTRNVVELGAPVVYFSTDYVFDGRKGEPYVESDGRIRSASYARTKLEGEQEVREGWIVRSSWLFGWTGHNFVRTMLRLGAERDEVSVVDDQRGSPTYVGHLAEATRSLLDRPHGLYHLAAEERLHLGRFRRGDLRGGGPGLPREPDHRCRVRLAGAAPRLLRATKREGRAEAAALARRPSRLPRPAGRVATIRLDPG